VDLPSRLQRILCFQKHSLCLFDHLAFVIIDSLGYEGTLKRLLADLFNQHDNAPDDVQLGWAQREDTFKTYILEQQ